MVRPEDSVRKLVSIAAILLMGVVIVGAVYGAVPGESETLSTNATVDYGNDTQLTAGEDVQGWSDPIVLNDSGGTILADGTDYQWHPGNATIDWLNTTETTTGETVAVTANYTSPGSTAEAAMVTIRGSFELGSIIPLVVVAVAILGLLGMFGVGSNSPRR